MTELTPPTAQDIYLISEDARLSQKLSSTLEDHSIYIPPANMSANKLLDLLPTMEPVLVVVDLSLASKRGFRIIRQMTVQRSSPLILAVGPGRLDRATCARQSLIAGATGYLSEDEIADTLSRALQQMKAGHIFLSEETKECLRPSEAMAS